MNLSVIIPSARASNLIPCVRALRACEPDLPILVVDDGARADCDEPWPNVTWLTGQRPFVFARNINAGIVATGSSDVVLLNDDAELLTRQGFTRLAQQVARRRGVGICSAGIRGVVCNPRQRLRHPPRFRDESHPLAFVCVYLPRAVIDRVGLLDERFVGYGFEDFDYCRRVQAAGFRLAIWDGCRVDHSGGLPSTYRTRSDISTLLAQGRQLYGEKWKGFSY